jgi:O-antigen/teichoic acid export membrane protein
MNSTTFRHKTVTGIVWNFLQQISRYGIQSGTTLLLAWFLVPEDFGLMAMVSVFFAVANSLMESGFNEAIIRKKEVSQTDYSTVFYINIVLGVSAYALLFVSAPLIGAFFNEPLLVALVRVVGLVVIINSFQQVQVADLTRRLEFRVQFRVALPAALLSGAVAVSMAILGFGVWSLAAQMLTSSLAVTVFYWIANDWRPSRDFSIESFHELFGFGSKLLVSGLIDKAFNNLYVVAIGRLFSATEAGFFFFSSQILILIVSLLSDVVQHVTYPALATLQDDNSHLKIFYRGIIQTVVYVIFPGLISLIVLAEPLFRLLLKEEWLPAVPYLQLLCIGGLMYPLHSINLNILKVKGRSDLFLYLEIIKKTIIGVTLLISLPYGIIGILIGGIVSSVLGYIPNSYFSNKLIDYSVPEQLRDVIPTLLVATAMGIIMYFLGLALPLDGLSKIVVLGVSGALFYVVINHLLKTQAQALLLNILEEQWRKKGAPHE